MKKIFFSVLGFALLLFPSIGLATIHNDEDFVIKTTEYIKKIENWVYYYGTNEAPNEHFAHYNIKNIDVFECKECDKNSNCSLYYDTSESIIKAKENLVKIIDNIADLNDLTDEEVEKIHIEQEKVEKTLFKLRRNLDTQMNDCEMIMDKLCNDFTDDKETCRYEHSEFTKNMKDYNEKDADDAFRKYEKTLLAIQYTEEVLYIELSNRSLELLELLSYRATNREMYTVEVDDTKFDYDNKDEDPDMLAGMPAERGNAQDLRDKLNKEEETIRFHKVEQDLFPSWRGSGMVEEHMEKIMHSMSPSEKEKLTRLQEQLQDRQKLFEKAETEYDNRYNEFTYKTARRNQSDEDFETAKEGLDACKDSLNKDDDIDIVCKQEKELLMKSMQSTSNMGDDYMILNDKLKTSEIAKDEAEKKLKESQAHYDDFMMKWHNLNKLPQGIIGRNCDGNFLLDYLPVFTKLILYFVAPLCALMMIYAGVRFIYGGGNSDSLSESKDWFMYAVIGFLLIILSYSLMKASYFLFATSEEEYKARMYECEQIKEEEKIMEIDGTKKGGSETKEENDKKKKEDENDEKKDEPKCEVPVIDEKVEELGKINMKPLRYNNISVNNESLIVWNNIVKKFKERDDIKNKIKDTKNATECSKLEISDNKIVGDINALFQNYCDKTEIKWIPMENEDRVPKLKLSDYEEVDGYEWIYVYCN